MILFRHTTPCPLLNDTKIFLFFFVFLELNDTWRVGKVLPGYSILEYVFPKKNNKNLISEWENNVKIGDFNHQNGQQYF